MAPTESSSSEGAAGDSGLEWREEAIAAGSLRRVELDGGVNGWAAPPGELFSLRQKGYFSGRRSKAPSGSWLLQPAGVDWLRSNGRIEHVLAREDNRVGSAFRRARRRRKAGNGGGAPAFLFAVNIQVPARPDAYSAVFYFAAEEPIEPNSLLGRFINGDDAFRNSRFKLINRIVRGPWIVRTAVGNYAACLVGRALTCHYYRGEDYLEVDVDVGSSAIASAILSIALGAVTAVTIDMGFAVESQAEEELPERLIGAVRIAQMQMGAASYVEAMPGADSEAPGTPGKSAGRETAPDAPGKSGGRGTAKVAHHNSRRYSR